MSSGQARPQREMLDLALEVVKLLADFTTRIAIGGSIRRGKAEVGDIEIVCQPAFKPLPSGRTGFLLIKQNGAHWITDRLRDDGSLEPRLNLSGSPEAWGPRHRRAYYKGVNLDLFIILPDRSWGRAMLICTGPLTANQVLVTHEGQINRNGDRGILPTKFQFREGELYEGETHLPTPEEGDVFGYLGMPYIPPPKRSVELYQRWAARRDIRDRPDAWLKQFGYLNQPTVGCERWRGDDIWIDGVQHQLRLIKVGTEKIKSYDANGETNFESAAPIESADRASVVI